MCPQQTKAFSWFKLVLHTLGGVLLGVCLLVEFESLLDFGKKYEALYWVLLAVVCCGCGLLFGHNYWVHHVPSAADLPDEDTWRNR